MPFYKACVRRGQRMDLTGFCGLSAKNIEEAEKRLSRELRKNPGRTYYYELWNESERPISVAIAPDLAAYTLVFMGQK